MNLQSKPKTESPSSIMAHKKTKKASDDAEYREMIDRHEDVEEMESLRFEYDGFNPVQ